MSVVCRLDLPQHRTHDNANGANRRPADSGDSEAQRGTTPGANVGRGRNRFERSAGRFTALGKLLVMTMAWFHDGLLLSLASVCNPPTDGFFQSQGAQL
jgi:hypothetical protein